MIKLTMEKLKVQLDQIFSPFLNPPASEEEIQRVENEMAIKFHQKNGFKIIGKREKIAQLHGEWKDLIFMERRSQMI